MTEPTPEAYEAAARAVAAEAPDRTHGQLCPRARSPLADIGLCDCWILPNARHDARFAVAAVWKIAEATVRAKVAAEMTQPNVMVNCPNCGPCCKHGVHETVPCTRCVDEQFGVNDPFAGRIAEGKGDET
jgi:hypothetical protein